MKPQSTSQQQLELPHSLTKSGRKTDLFREFLESRSRFCETILIPVMRVIKRLKPLNSAQYTF